MENELVVLVAMSATSGWIGWWLHKVYSAHQFKKLVDKIQNRLDKEYEEMERNSVHLKMEVIDGKYYFYNKDNDAFFYTASSKDELINYITKHHADKNVFIDNSALKILENA